MPDKAQIFISYRRDDAAGYARAVYDELARHFGDERVFMDVDDIGAGLAFDQVIASAVGESEVLLVMIGKRWLGERGSGQPPRIADENDFVRIEVASGLTKGMRVIPLLLDGTAMPGEAQLPESIRALAKRNALAIANTSYAADLARLVAAVRDAIGEPAQPVDKPRRWTIAVAASLAAAATLGALWHWQRGDDNPSAAAPPLRPAINGQWLAELDYDWPNAHYKERFEFSGEGGELHGSASFLRVPRGILEGAVDAKGLSFVTRTSEVAGGATRELVHRYRGKLAGAGEIRFVMQTEGGESAHRPVEFVARRPAPE